MEYANSTDQLLHNKRIKSSIDLMLSITQPILRNSYIVL